jgi:hypothetical protein
MYPLLAGLGEAGPELPSPALFVIGFLSPSDSCQMSDDVGAVGNQAGPHATFGDRSEQLLGASAPDAEERLKGGAVDQGVSAFLEPPEGFREAVEPKRLVGHRG